MSFEWLSLILLVFHTFRTGISSSSTTPQADDGRSFSANNAIFQKVEGKVEVKGASSDDWMVETQVCLNGGEYCGFLKSSGSFTIHNVPPGSYLVEVFSPNYVFESVRVDISSKNGKIRARKVNLLKSGSVSQLPYPLQFETRAQATFFEKRESWSVLNTLKNPMVSCISICSCL